MFFNGQGLAKTFSRPSFRIFSSYLNLNQFAPGIFFVFPDTHTGFFFAKNPQKILAINNYFVNETKSRHPNKCLFHWYFENLMASFFITVVFLRQN